MSIGCKIIRDFPRPDPELVELFRDLPVANIDDCMERTAAVDSAIVPLGKGQLLGSAFTVRVLRCHIHIPVLWQAFLPFRNDRKS